MNRAKTRLTISSALEPYYGKREADNIAQYYIDATRQIELDEQRLLSDLSLLVRGKPVQQVVGLAFFYGLQFRVTEAVLIPRPETEELVHWIIEDNKNRDSGLSIMDLGVGSGCILLTLMKHLNVSQGYGLDLSEKALEVFMSNASAMNLAVTKLKMNLLAEDLSGLAKVDVIVSNPPYILEEEKALMAANVLDHEPHVALFVDGEDPLVFYKRTIEIAQTQLLPGGLLYFETSHLYKDLLEDYLVKQGLCYVFKKDLQGNPRMLKLSF